MAAAGFFLFEDYLSSTLGGSIGLRELGWIDGIDRAGLDWIIVKGTLRWLNWMVGRAWDGDWEKRNVRTYCIVLLCSLLAGCACVFHLVLVMPCVWVSWYATGEGKGMEMLMWKGLLQGYSVGSGRHNRGD
jgi:hypothetical protein